MALAAVFILSPTDEIRDGSLTDIPNQRLITAPVTDVSETVSFFNSKGIVILALCLYSAS